MTITDKRLIARAFKTNLSDFAPPYICYVGNPELLYNLDSTYIISAGDAMRIPLPDIFSDIQNMVFILDSLQAVNQLGKSELYWNKCVIISSLGLANQSIILFCVIKLKAVIV